MLTESAQLHFRDGLMKSAGPRAIDENFQTAVTELLLGSDKQYLAVQQEQEARRPRRESGGQRFRAAHRHYQFGEDEVSKGDHHVQLLLACRTDIS